MSTCTHELTTAGAARCYTHSVAAPPYTDENPAAHGGITYPETCSHCGAQRSVNENGWHVEAGPWGPSRAARQAAKQAATRKQRQAQQESDAVAAKLVGVSVRRVESPELDDDAIVVVARSGELDATVRLHQIESAATQEDTGDALVPAYRHLLATANRMVLEEMQRRSGY